jgi:surface antigen Omp85-like protein
MGMPWRPTVIVSAILVAVCARPAPAQDTRADAIAAEQAEKAKTLHPYEPTRAERLALRAKRALVDVPSGFYPAFGSILGGGGIGFGAGYRQFSGDRTFWDLRGLLSIRGYKLVELNAQSPGHAGDRIDLYARGGWLDATQVGFYGIGTDSPRDRSNFRMKEIYSTGGLAARPARWTVLGGAVAYENYTIEEGLGAAPPVGQKHTALTAPGLGVSPIYIHSSASAGIDWRPAAGYARRGGLYQLTYHNFADTDSTYSFDRLDAELVQHVPILRENWVLSFRGDVQTTLGDDDQVPFFMLPSLGSGRTLRGYHSWRFRDRHRMLVSAEWRWIPSMLFFDMALFYDAGKVASRRSDLDFSGLKSDFGIGARFHSPAATPFRIDIARSNEGFRFVFTSGAAF